MFSFFFINPLFDDIPKQNIGMKASPSQLNLKINVYEKSENTETFFDFCILIINRHKRSR